MEGKSECSRSFNSCLLTTNFICTYLLNTLMLDLIARENKISFKSIITFAWFDVFTKLESLIDLDLIGSLVHLGTS